MVVILIKMLVRQAQTRHQRFVITERKVVDGKAGVTADILHSRVGQQKENANLIIHFFFKLLAVNFIWPVLCCGMT